MNARTNGLLSFYVIGSLFVLFFAVILCYNWPFTRQPVKLSPKAEVASAEKPQSVNSDYSNVADNENIKASKLTPDDLTFVLRDTYGLSFHLRKGKFSSIGSWKSEGTLSEDLKNLANTLGVALIFNPADAKDKIGRDLFLTKDALYLGTDKQVLEMLDRLGDDSAEIRAEAVRDIGIYNLQTSNFQLEPVIARTLARDLNPEVRQAAAAGLEEAKAPGTVDILIAALSDSDDLVREHARTSLGQIYDKQVYAKLKEAHEMTSDNDTREIIEQIMEEVYGEPLHVQN
jgi:hypothetical protein